MPDGLTSLVLAARADRDIGEIFDYLEGVGGLPVAVSYDRAFDDLFIRLMDFPELGSPRPTLGRGVRIGVVRPYIVVYRFHRRRDRLEILRVLHGHRDLRRILRQSPAGSA